MNHEALAAYLTTGGTIFVAIVAIWGDWFRAKLAPPKLEIQPHNIRGRLTYFSNGKRGIFYHLKVTNLRHWFGIKNCRVMLCQLHRRASDGQFKRVPLPVPQQYIWSPAEFTPVLQTVHREAVFDLGYIEEGGDTFTSRLYSVPNDFEGFVGPNEAVRFSMEVVADKYISEIYQVFEVAWNGKWSEKLDEMENNLTIKEIKK